MINRILEIAFRLLLLVAVSAMPSCGPNCSGDEDDCEHGTYTPENCGCECDEPWTGSDCDECEEDCDYPWAVHWDDDTGFCGCRCEPEYDEDDDCEDNGGEWNSNTCSCDCPEGLCGPLCETPVEDCPGNEEWDFIECECYCPEGWCGDNCNTPVQDCVNGIWDEANCECDCDEGWAGLDCSEELFGELDNVLTYDIVEVENGIETVVETIQIVNNNPEPLYVSLQDFPANFGTNMTNGYLLVQFLGILELQPNTSYEFSETQGAWCVFQFPDAPLFFDGWAVEGWANTSDLAPVFQCDFEFTVVNDTQDTLKLQNGFVQWVE